MEEDMHHQLQDEARREEMLLHAAKDLVAWAKQPAGKDARTALALLWAPASPDTTSSSTGQQQQQSMVDWSCPDITMYAITLILRSSSETKPTPGILGRLLQVAARAGLTGMVRALVQTGADLEVRGLWRIATGASLSLQALQVAAAAGHEDLVLYLLSQPNVRTDATVKGGRTVLHVAASCGQERVVRRLLSDSRVDKEARDNERRTPFHVAVLSGQEKVARCMIEEGDVDREAKDGDGYRAVHLAVLTGDTKMLKFLIVEGGVDKEGRDQEGRSALHLAAEKNRETVMRFLVERAGLDRHATTTAEGRETALHRAAFQGHLRLVRYLLAEAGLNRLARDAWGHTAMHLAAYRGHEAVVRYITEAPGSGLSTRDAVSSDGRTALHLAAMRGHETIVRYLLGQCGVSSLTGLKDQSGCTVADLVSPTTHPRVATLIATALHHQDASYATTDLRLDDQNEQQLSARGIADLLKGGGGGPYATALRLVSFREQFLGSGGHGDDVVLGPPVHACLEVTMMTPLKKEAERQAALASYERDRRLHANIHHPRIAQYMGRVVVRGQDESGGLLELVLGKKQDEASEVCGVLVERVDGSLAWHLRELQAKGQREEEGDVAWGRALLLAAEVAEGIEVLHSQTYSEEAEEQGNGKAKARAEELVTHGDLHVSSVLIKDGHALLTKPKGPRTTYGAKHADVVAPEASPKATTAIHPAVDMFALGVILARLAIWAAATTAGQRGDDEWCTAGRTAASLPGAFVSKAQAAWEQCEHEQVAALMQACLSPDPKSRPTSKAAKAVLAKAKEPKPTLVSKKGANNSSPEASPNSVTSTDLAVGDGSRRQQQQQQQVVLKRGGAMTTVAAGGVVALLEEEGQLVRANGARPQSMVISRGTRAF